MRSYLNVIKSKAKLSIGIFLDNLLPWKRISKFSIHRDFYTEGKRYSLYNKNDCFVNIGAGSYFFHPRWDCLDFYNNGLGKVNKRYIQWDFTKKKELPKKYKLAYCSHVIEHIPRIDTNEFLSIISRAMVKGGILRIAVPDADLAYSAYLQKHLISLKYIVQK